jgi:hypothetical protein
LTTNISEGKVDYLSEMHSCEALKNAAALAVDIRRGLDLSAAFWQRLLRAIIIGILASWVGSIFFCFILIIVAIILFFVFDKPTGVQFPKKDIS